MPEQLQLGGLSDVDAKVRMVCFSPAAADLDRAVLVILSVHRGAANAIPSAEIAERVHLSPGEASRRLIAGAVESLVNFHRIPVGGSRVKPYGYFLIESAADLKQALAPLPG